MVIRPGVSAIILTPSDNGLWGLPGGGVEPGESVTEAIVREETGLEVTAGRLLGVYYVSSSFECRWYDPHALPAEMMPMHRVRIADALAGQGAAFVR